ncbi:MAG: oxidoreductase [Deltaproteobacteria bacterium]|nr:oxidoreductase [Deltaproteobacteria bacterium]
MRSFLAASVIGLCLGPLACSHHQSSQAESAEAQKPSEGSWESFDTSSTASLRGLSAVDRETAWASGTGGTVLRTEDGGQTWKSLLVLGGEDLDFRDVQALGNGVAVLMTAGQPARLYRTEDGGQSFSLVHESSYPGAFFDAMAFWDDQRGLVMSDPVEGNFLLLETRDGGRSWQRLPIASLPVPREGEAGFAASGSNLAVGPKGRAWLGTGGGAARVLYSEDFGASWKVSEAPLAHGEASQGVFSVAFRDSLHGIAAGGDYLQPELAERSLAITRDGGTTWTPASTLPPSGHRAAVVFLDYRPDPTWVSCGRAGCDISEDDGTRWKRLSEEGFYTLSAAPDGSLWAAGSEGRVARWKADHRPTGD